jgi:peptidoglycan-associated lipoprotein
MHCDNGQCAEGASNISSACRSSVPGEKVKLLTVNFDFDRSDLRIDARNTLEQNAECLKQAGGVQIVLEGHCDERGTQEYNLALGEKRAAAVTSYLKNLGVNTSNLRTVSKGKNEPVCQEESDSCHDRNRRVEFIQR